MTLNSGNRPGHKNNISLSKNFDRFTEVSFLTSTWSRFGLCCFRATSWLYTTMNVGAVSFVS